VIEPAAAELLMQAHNAGLICRDTWGSIAGWVARYCEDWGQHYNATCKQLSKRVGKAFGASFPSAAVDKFEHLLARDTPTAIALWSRVQRRLIRGEDIVRLCNHEDFEHAAKLLLVRSELRSPRYDDGHTRIR
jgi:hypothetical protein